MEPEEWQRLAEETAAEVSSALDELEATFWPEPSDPSFRTFWTRIRELSEQLRTAAAIDIEPKLALQARIRQLTKQARVDQEVHFAEQRHRKQELLDRVQELRDAALASSNPEEIRGIRQELTGMREAVTEAHFSARGDRQETWQAWQTAAQEAWDHLSALWNSNEAALTALLDDAKARLDRGQVREARDFIRDFNTMVREREVSHKSSRVLRSQANTVWKEAEDVGKAKHEAFMATAPQRVERWKHVKGKNASAIARLRAEIGQHERDMDSGGVAAAFARALLEDKQRELKRLEADNESIGERIESTETALVG
jgi:hypothetical protein